MLHFDTIYFLCSEYIYIKDENQFLFRVCISKAATEA